MWCKINHQYITGDEIPKTGRCRGGPYHGKVFTKDAAWAVEKKQNVGWDMRGMVPAAEIDYYLWTHNPETDRWEWIWNPLRRKLIERWDKKKEIEKLMRRIYGGFAMQGNHVAQRDVQRVLELVYKL